VFQNFANDFRTDDLQRRRAFGLFTPNGRDGVPTYGNDDVFQHKLRSIEAYRSQLKIASLVDSIRQDGPYEYLRDVNFRLYSS